MKLSVVTDQPWDVAVDVLVVPVASEPAFDGELGEIDRRSGGELHRLREFGELSGKRFASTLAAGGGEVRAARILAVGIGAASELDRETVVHVAASAERRLGGRTVRTVAFLVGPLGGIDGGDGRGRRRAHCPRCHRGQLRPVDDLPRRAGRDAAAAGRADQSWPAPGAGSGCRPARAAERGRPDHRRRRELDAAAGQPVGQRRQPRSPRR